MAESRQQNDVGEWLSGVAQNAGIGDRLAPSETAIPVIDDPADNEFKPYGGLDQSFVDGLARQLNRPIDASMGRDQIMALDHLANGMSLSVQGFGDMSGIPLELRVAALGANQDVAKGTDYTALRQQWEAEAAEKARVQEEEKQSSLLAQMAEAPWSARLPPIIPPPAVPSHGESEVAGPGRYGLILDESLFRKPRELPDISGKLEELRSEAKLPIGTPPFVPPRMNG